MEMQFQIANHLLKSNFNKIEPQTKINKSALRSLDVSALLQYAGHSCSEHSVCCEMH